MKNAILKIFALSACLFSNDKLFAGDHDLSSGLNFSGPCFSYFQTDYTLLNKQLQLWGAPGGFKSHYNSFGLMTHTVGLRVADLSFDGSASIEYILPQRIAVGSGDSLVFRLHGWHLTTSLIGIDVIPAKPIALVLGPGFDWGSMRLKKTENGDDIEYKNPFVSPFGKADLIFSIGHLAFGARFCYRYDLTKSAWKRKTDHNETIPGTKFSGWGGQVFIGWQN